MSELDERLEALLQAPSVARPPTLDRVVERRRRRRAARFARVGMLCATVLIAGAFGAGLALSSDDGPVTSTADGPRLAAAPLARVVEMGRVPAVDTDSLSAHVVGNDVVVLTVDTATGRFLAFHDSLEDPTGWERVDLPFPAREGHATVVTSNGLFVWGGFDRSVGRPSTGAVHPEGGFVLKPADSAWVEVPQGPLTPRTGATAGWTGAEVAVIGGSRSVGPPTEPIGAPAPIDVDDAAAFDPHTGEWRSIDAPAVLGSLVVEQPDRLVIVGPDGATSLSAGSSTWQPTEWTAAPDGAYTAASGAGRVVATVAAGEDRWELVVIAGADIDRWSVGAQGAGCRPRPVSLTEAVGFVPCGPSLRLWDLDGRRMGRVELPEVLDGARVASSAGHVVLVESDATEPLVVVVEVHAD